MGPGKYNPDKSQSFIAKSLVNPPLNKEKLNTFTEKVQKNKSWVPGPGHHYKDAKAAAGHDVQKLIVKCPPSLRTRRH